MLPFSVEKFETPQTKTLDFKLTQGQKPHRVRSGKWGDHSIEKSRLMTLPWMKCWRNSYFTLTLMCGGASSCIKIDWWRQFLCCSCGMTNVFNISWYLCALTGHVLNPVGLTISKKNGPIMNSAVTFGECNKISCTMWGCSQVQFRLFCLFTDLLR